MVWVRVPWGPMGPPHYDWGPWVPARQGRLQGDCWEGISLLGRKSGGPRGCRKRQAGVAFTAGKALAGREGSRVTAGKEVDCWEGTAWARTL